MAPPARSIL